MAQRLAQIEWRALGQALDEYGFATAPGVLTADECSELIACFGRATRFRKWIDMERFRFGRGQYAYFAEPLPRVVATLRAGLYRHLVSIANRSQERLGASEPYPPSLRQYRAVCRRAGQSQPTPLLLRYAEGGFNCLHRDVYGELRFPLQATVMLSKKLDYEGGEFLLVENRPRQQARAEVIELSQGEMVVFFGTERPVPGARATVRAELRHGVSRVRAGERWTLGIIFHDAQ